MMDCFRFRRFDREDFIALYRGDSSAMLSPRIDAVNHFVCPEACETDCPELLLVASFKCFLIASGKSPVRSHAVEISRYLMIPSASSKM